MLTRADVAFNHAKMGTEAGLSPTRGTLACARTCRAHSFAVICVLAQLLLTQFSLFCRSQDHGCTAAAVWSPKLAEHKQHAQSACPMLLPVMRQTASCSWTLVYASLVLNTHACLPACMNVCQCVSAECLAECLADGAVCECCLSACVCLAACLFLSVCP